MLSPYLNLDYIPPDLKAKFRDYSSSSQTGHPFQPRGAMGELQRESRSHNDSFSRRHSDSPVSRLTRMDSPSSESMDSIAETCHVNNRKRRRGVIEKRRRDRINNSLAELRRLVPSAFEKQGSTKLEKAEILQMTVDHLKSIHTKGINCDPNAIDAHTMGFQECAAEVNRLLTGQDFPNSDPIRSRLMSHLQCYSAQRESIKQQTTWHHPSSYPTGPTGLTLPPPPPGMAGSSLFNSSADAHVRPSLFSPSADSHAHSSTSLQSPSCLGTAGMAYTSVASSSFTTPSFSAQNFGQYPSFTGSTAMQYMNAATSQAGYPSTSRPLRPWGAAEIYSM